MAGAGRSRDVVEHHLLAAAGPARRRRQQPRDAEAQLLRDAAAHDRAVHQRPPVGVRRAAQRSTTAGAADQLLRLLRRRRRGSGGRSPDGRGAVQSAAGRRSHPPGATVRPLGEGSARAAGLPGSLASPRANRPYDVTAWTLGLQMGVTVNRNSTPERQCRWRPDRPGVRPAGRIIGSGQAIAHHGRTANAAATLINRLWAKGATVALGAIDAASARTHGAAPGNRRGLGSAVGQ